MALTRRAHMGCPEPAKSVIAKAAMHHIKNEYVALRGGREEFEMGHCGRGV